MPFTKANPKTEKKELEKLLSSCAEARRAHKEFQTRIVLQQQSDLDVLIDELMQDPEFREEYQKLQPGMDFKRALMKNHINADMSQM